MFSFLSSHINADMPNSIKCVLLSFLILSQVKTSLVIGEGFDGKIGLK